MWRVAEHSDSENSRWILLRSIEWVQWPLFISQPIVPILLWFCEWQPVVLAVAAVSILWRLAIATWFVSVRLADLGPILVLLKFVACPVMAFLIWRQGSVRSRAGAPLADCGSFDSAITECNRAHSLDVCAPKCSSSRTRCHSKQLHYTLIGELALMRNEGRG
jgi:hypothetical protein